MIRKLFFATSIVAAFATSALADPILSVQPLGLQGGNWVWQVNITPDLVLAGGPTALGLELGFRLNDPLVSVTNMTPSVFDTNNPGHPIFGWEAAYGSPAFPEGIEAKCAACSVTNAAIFGGHASTVVSGATNEVFSAMGSGIIATPGAVPFLKIVAAGPINGGPATSTLQWLGAYNGNGRIAQFAGPNAQNFDKYSGTLSQSVPEPASGALIATAAVGALAMSNRRAARVRRG
jgi:hypothetical protein